MRKVKRVKKEIRVRRDKRELEEEELMLQSLTMHHLVQTLEIYGGIVMILIYMYIMVILIQINGFL